MNAKEARESATRIVKLEQNYRLGRQIWEDEKMLETAVENAVRRGCLVADTQIEFDPKIDYDCGDADCHIGKFHSKAEYVERLINLYVNDGYAIRYEYADCVFVPYDGSIKCTPGRILRLEISW